MSLEENFNNKNRRRQHPEEEDLFDDVEIESEELFPDEDEDEKDLFDEDAKDGTKAGDPDEDPWSLRRKSSYDEDDDPYLRSRSSYSEEEDEIVGDEDMGDKLLRGGMGRSTRDHRRRAPRELNSPDSIIDSRQRHKEHSQKKKSRIKRIIICAVVELITLCVIFGYGYVLRTFNLMARTEVDVAAVENDNISFEKKQEMEGYWNIAVFGLDASKRNSDVIMIVSVNQDTGDIKLVSVFRDTYLNISSKDQYNKINQAYAQGGPEQGLAALNKNLDLNITNYVTFDWKTIAEIINMMGGVDDIEISNAEFYYINAYITENVETTGIPSRQLKSAGVHHLDGIQAVAYARLRLMDSDFARTERQKKIIKACFEKAKTMDYANLNYIMMTCFPKVETNVSLNDVVGLAQGILRYNIADTGGFPWSRGDARIPNKGSCVIPTTLESNVIMLHEFLFGDEDYEVSDAVLRYSEKIKQDSNLYKEGKPIESVATDQGVIQKPKVSQEGTEEDTMEVTEAPTEREMSEEDYTLGVDENGELIYPTDENGDIVIPTDADGNVIYPTDEYGNEIRGDNIFGTRPGHERPTDLADDSIETGGDAGSEIVDDEGNVIGTSPTRENGHTRPQRPSQTEETDEAGRPIIRETEGPGPGETSSRPETGSSGHGSGSTGSGGNSGNTGNNGPASGGSGGQSSVTDIPDEPVTVPATSAPVQSAGPIGSAQGPGGAQSSGSGVSQAPGGQGISSGFPVGDNGMSSVTGPGM